MEIDHDKNLHMKEGSGTYSYANNSPIQETVIKKTRPLVEEALKEVYHVLKPETLMITDMGCSSGPNALLIVSEIIDIIDGARRSLNRRAPHFGVFLNDLPGNDFNNLFSLIPNFMEQVKKEKGNDFGACFVSGTPGSFYDRLFPDEFLHFVHSSYAIHFLSEVPKGLLNEEGEALNKTNIYITKTSPPQVVNAYRNQFKKDFKQFLKLRAKEMVHGGHMILTLIGSTNGYDPYSTWSFLGSTLYDMVLEGALESKKLENFNIPFYSPTIEEMKEIMDEVKKSTPLSLNKIESFTSDWRVDPTQNLDDQAKIVAHYIRAVAEPLLVSTLGFDEPTLNHLFVRFQMKLKLRIYSLQKCEFFTILLSITKKV